MGKTRRICIRIAVVLMFIVTLFAGLYTFKETKKTSPQVTTVTASPVTGDAVFMVEGASIRLIEPYGLRFSAYVDESLLEAGVTTGILIHSANYVNATVNGTAYGDLTFDNYNWVVPSKVYYESTDWDGYKKFTAVITETYLPKKYYAFDWTARAYVVYPEDYSSSTDSTYASATEVTLPSGYGIASLAGQTRKVAYTDVLVTRSATEVASKATLAGEKGEKLDEYRNIVTAVEIVDASGNVLTEATTISLNQKTVQLGVKVTTVSGLHSKSNLDAIVYDWMSKDPNIADLDENGLLTLKRPGKARLDVDVGTVFDEVTVTITDDGSTAVAFELDYKPAFCVNRGLSTLDIAMGDYPMTSISSVTVQHSSATAATTLTADTQYTYTGGGGTNSVLSFPASTFETLATKGEYALTVTGVYSSGGVSHAVTLTGTMVYADYGIGTAAEFSAFGTACNVGGSTLTSWMYVIVDNDIDYMLENFSSHYAGGYFYGTFDGQGHTIHNITCTNAVFCGIYGDSTTKSIVKNVAFTNVYRPTANGGALFVNDFAHATVENVYVSGRFTGGVDNVAGFSRSATDVTVNNCVVRVEFQGQYQTNQSAFTRSYVSGTFTNCYAITNSSNGSMLMTNTGTTASPVYAANDTTKAALSDSNLYTSTSFKSASSTVLSNLATGSDYWTLVDGALMFKTTEQFVVRKLTFASSVSGSLYNTANYAFLSNASVVHANAYDATGASIDSSTTFDQTTKNETYVDFATAGQAFFITATYYDSMSGRLYTITTPTYTSYTSATELTFDAEVEIIVNRGAGVSIELKDANQTDSPTVVDTLVLMEKGTTDVAAMTDVTGFEMTTGSDGVVTLSIPASSFSGINSKYYGHEYVLSIVVYEGTTDSSGVISAEQIYEIGGDISIVDFMIGTAAEFSDFGSAVSDREGSTSRSAYYHVEFDANIDYGGANFADYYKGGFMHVYMDGHGYTINNVKVRNALFAGVSGTEAVRSTIKNLSVTNITHDQPNGGGLFINDFSHADVSNCFVQGVYSGYEGHVISGFTGSTSSGSPTITNCVVHVETTDRVGDLDAFAHACNHDYCTGSYRYRGSITNCYSVSGTSSGQMYAAYESSVWTPVTDGLYTSAAAFAAGVTNTTENAEAFGEYWEYNASLGWIPKTAVQYVNASGSITDSVYYKNRDTEGDGITVEVSSLALEDDLSNVRAITVGDETIDLSTVTCASNKLTIPASELPLNSETHTYDYIVSIVGVEGSKVSYACGKLESYDYGIGSVDEFSAFGTYCNVGGATRTAYAAAILTDNIDYGHLSFSAYYAGGYFYGYFDGQGYTINNIGCTNAVFPGVCGIDSEHKTTVKDVAFTNVVRNTYNGGGIFANAVQYANVDNVYASGILTSYKADIFGGFAGTIWSEATITNCAVNVKMTSGKQFNAFAYSVGATSTIENCYAFAEGSNGYMYDYVTDGFATSVTEVPTGFDSELWQVTDSGKLAFKSAVEFATVNYDDVTCAYDYAFDDAHTVTAGQSFLVYLNTPAELSFAESLDGVTVQGSQVYVGTGVTSGTFTLQATLYNMVTDETGTTTKTLDTFTVGTVSASSPTALTISSTTTMYLNRQAYLNVDLTYAQADLHFTQVYGATLDGTAINFLKSSTGYSVYLSGDAFSTANANLCDHTHTYVITGLGADGVEYTVTGTVVIVDFAIGTIAEFDAFLAYYAANGQYTVDNAAGNAHMPWTYAILTSNIDYGGGNVSAHYANNTYNAAYFFGTFDGMGYVISNFSTVHGLFPQLWGGTVTVNGTSTYVPTTIKNLALVNVVKNTANGGGIFANQMKDTVIENVYIQGTRTSYSNAIGPVFASHSGGTVSLTNVVVDVEWASTSTTGACYAFTSMTTAGVTTLTNCYAISTTSNGSMYPTTATGLTASGVALYTSRSDFAAGVTSSATMNTSYWTYDSTNGWVWKKL